MKTGIKKFFAYARERQAIHLRKRAGGPRPWTKDAILGHYRFCCVFREDDKTTTWLRENVRKKYGRTPNILPATVLFRLFNRIETGKAMFTTGAFDEYLETGRRTVLKKAILAQCGEGPYVTGSYIIAGPPGHNKLDGMLQVFRDFYKSHQHVAAARLMTADRGEYRLEHCWKWLREFPYFGDFHSYEIVTDLRHTYLLDRAPDIMTWANPGPGANRGANRVFGRDVDQRNSKEQLNAEMRQLLDMSRGYEYWPQHVTNGSVKIGDYPEPRLDCAIHSWPKWEMRDVEHTLCEFDKYERARLGQGRPRGVYR